MPCTGIGSSMRVFQLFRDLVVLYHPDQASVWNDAGDF